MPFNLFCHIGRKNLIFRADPSNNKKTLPKPEGHFSIGFEKKLKCQSYTYLESLVGPFSLIRQIANIIQTNRITRIQPEISDLEI